MRWRRRRLAIVLLTTAVAAGGSAVAVASGLGAPTIPPGTPPAPPASSGPPPRPAPLPSPTTAPAGPVNYSQLEAVARAAGAHFGDSAPQNIRTVTGLEQASAAGKVVNAVVGADAGRLVDVVQESGNFTFDHAPAGQTAPIGHVLTMVVDRATGRVTDISMAVGAGQGPDISQFDQGAAVPLP